MLHDAHLQDWMRMHALLMQRERMFAAKALEHALGRVTAEELDALQRELRALRALTDAIFEQAFGVPAQRRRD